MNDQEPPTLSRRDTARLAAEMLDKQASRLTHAATNGSQTPLSGDREYQKDHRRVSKLLGTLGLLNPIPYATLAEWNGRWKRNLPTWKNRRECVDHFVAETVVTLDTIQASDAPLSAIVPDPMDPLPEEIDVQEQPSYRAHGFTPYNDRMAKKTGKLFISHAGDDKDYVTTFVSQILRLGCGFPRDDVFYTSERGMGVKSGADLFAEMRKEAAESPLVIAIVSPVYLTRATCLAEMGAAWAQGTLLPILTPGLQREDLEGPLKSMLVGKLDDDGAAEYLDEMHDRVIEVFGLKANTADWNVQKDAWLDAAEEHKKLLGTVETYSAADVAKIEAKLEETTQLHNHLVKSLAELQVRYDKLHAARTEGEVAEAVLPNGEIEQFEQLSRDVVSYFNKKHLPRCVIKAIRYHVAGKELLLADAAHDDNNENPEFMDAEDQGYLSIDSDPSEVRLSLKHPKVKGAIKVVEAFAEWFDSPSRTDEFEEWFGEQHDLPVDSSNSEVWDAVLIP